MTPTARERRLRFALLATCCLLLALLAVLASKAVPLSEAVRLRNALHFDSAPAASFEWTPSSRPDDFLVEDAPADERLLQAAAAAGVRPEAGDWANALAISSYLTEHAAGKGGIDDGLFVVLKKIREGYGACSDFTQAFIGIASASGLFAREWAFSFDGYGGDGHAAIEVFDRQQQRWIYLDVFNNFFVEDAASGRPLSAREFRDALKGDPDAIVIRKAGAGRPGFAYEEVLREYYRAGADEWYLWWGNAQLSREGGSLKAGLRSIHPYLARAYASIVGDVPDIKAVASATNAPQRARMERLRKQLHLLLAALAGGAVILSCLLYRLHRQGHRQPRGESIECA
ncbi:MAG: hypothetical protein H6950_06170 [Zoogloeaceae bacterium]|nr:hypothetical protein [Zoogloeaceae bacterium]